MLNLPEVKRKTRKASYRKPKSVKELEIMADAEARLLHPTCPHLAPRTFKDNSANSLTGCIVKYITLKGGFASRISNQGTFNKKLNKYIRGTSRKGLADVMATYRGKSLHIEVKHGKDVQSESQKKVEQEVIRADGFYFLAHNFTEFKSWFESELD